MRTPSHAPSFFHPSPSLELRHLQSAPISSPQSPPLRFPQEEEALLLDRNSIHIPATPRRSSSSSAFTPESSILYRRGDPHISGIMEKIRRSKVSQVVDKLAVSSEPGLTNAQLMLTNHDLKPGESSILKGKDVQQSNLRQLSRSGDNGAPGILLDSGLPIRSISYAKYKKPCQVMI